MKTHKFKGKINKYTIIVGDFNASLSTINRPGKPNVKIDVEDLNNTINHLHQIDADRTLHTMTSKLLFKHIQGMITKRDHMLDHKTGMSKGKILWNMFSN